MTGIYLQCETCDATIGGEEVTSRIQGIPTLSRWEGERLRCLAAERGWSHDGGDFCPECIAKRLTAQTDAV